MAQNRLRDYEEPVGSFDHNIFNLGLHSPGRYVGFDDLQKVSSLTFKIGHGRTGFTYTDVINTSKGPTGVLLTPQGVIVHEDTAIGPLAIETNLGNGSKRFDLVVCNHQYVSVAGGQAATYSVIKGPLGSEVKPTPTDAQKQTVIGYIELPSNASDINQCTWHKAKCPDSGDGEDARITHPNVFRATNFESLSAVNYTAPDLVKNYGTRTVSLYTFNPDGNVIEMQPNVSIEVDGFRIKDMPVHNGARIRVIINHLVTFRESFSFESDPTAYNLGYRAISINPTLGNINVGADGGNVMGVKNLTDPRWEVEFVFFGGRWMISNIGGMGSGSLQTVKQGVITAWYGNFNAMFDATGLGVFNLAGYALCNGNNGTPDLRGKMLAMSTDVQAAGQPDLSTEQAIIDQGLLPEHYIIESKGAYVGTKTHTLLKTNLPNLELRVDDPGHEHGVYTANSQTGSGKFTVGGDGEEGTRPKTWTSKTFIKVFLDGDGTPVYHIPPVWMTVFIMKL